MPRFKLDENLHEEPLAGFLWIVESKRIRIHG